MKKLIIALTALFAVSANAGESISEKCKETVEKAVMVKALKMSETASLVGMKTVYGKSLSLKVTIVGVSDETEPSHYIVVTHSKTNTYSKEQSYDCTIKFISMSADGLLPEVDGLNDY